MMKPKYIKIVSIISSIILLLGISFLVMKMLSEAKKEIPVKEKKERKRYVKASPVKYYDISTSIRQTGRVVSQNKIDLTTEVRGKILKGKIDLKKGEKFKKGDVLLKIFNSDAVLALKARKSRFLNSLSNLLPDFKIDFPESYTTWYDFFENININKTLSGLPKISSGKQKIFLASRNILSDYYTIKSEEVRLSKYVIYAPFSGSITDVYAQVGSVANPGARIATLIKTEKLELEIPTEPENSELIHIGDKVKIYRNNQSQICSGIVIRKAGFVDEKTQSIPIFVNIEEETDVFQGQYMTAEFSDIIIKNADLINRNAVFNHNEIYIVKDGKLQKKIINIVKVNENTYIYNGLDENEIIVREPLINVDENMKVEIKLQ